jgi:hypothetical protein
MHGARGGHGDDHAEPRPVAAPALRHRPRRVGSTRVEKEAEGCLAG